MSNVNCPAITISLERHDVPARCCSADVQSRTREMLGRNEDPKERTAVADRFAGRGENCVAARNRKNVLQVDETQRESWQEDSCKERIRQNYSGYGGCLRKDIGELADTIEYDKTRSDESGPDSGEGQYGQARFQTVTTGG